MTKLMIILASTRPGRVGLPVARWFEARARAHGAFEVELVDLAELDLPLLDEPNHPAMRSYANEHTKAWSARVEAADAFALVMPEYNHSFTAPLKNAIDYLHFEWHHKPVGIVSYGGVSAGARAVTALEPVLTVLRMTPLPEAVHIPFVAQFIDEDGVLDPNEVMDQACAALLDALERMSGVLAALR